MTPKEAHRYVEDLQRMLTQYRFHFSEKFIEANGMAIVALEKQEKYAWHDLRKNPEDLPPYNKDVLVCCVNQSGKKAQFVMWYNELEGWLFQNDKPCCEQIAWRYIEPFEEDKECYMWTGCHG